MANAPAEATYWLETPNPSLPNSIALNSFNENGLVKVSSSTGAPSLAVPDVDYMSASQELLSIRDLNPQFGSLLIGQNPEEWALLNPPTQANQALFWNGTTLGYQKVASITSTYITLTPSSTLTSYRILEASNGLTLVDGGPLGNVTITPTSKLASLQSLSTPGIVCVSDANTALTRTIISSIGSIAVTNPTGAAGNINLEVSPDTSLQRIKLSVSGSQIGQRSNINLIPGSGMGITAVDNGSSNRVDVTLTSTGGGGGGGGNNSNVVTLTNQTSIYPNSFNLSTLSTGLLKVTTGTGNLTTAVAGTDYLLPSANLTTLSSASHSPGTLYTGDGSGIQSVPIGPSGNFLQSVAGYPAWTPLPPSLEVLKPSDASYSYFLTWNASTIQIQQNNAGVPGPIGLLYDTVINPPPGSGSSWSQYAATQNVDIAGFNIRGVNTINTLNTRVLNSSDSTGNTYYNLNWNTTGVQVQKVNSGTVAQTGILYDSVINPPPSSSAWSQYAATSNVAMAGFDLQNVNNINTLNTRVDSPSISNTYYQLSYADTGVQVEKVNSGVVAETGILYDSVINPPPSGSEWSQYAATSNVAMAGFDLQNVNNINTLNTRVDSPSISNTYYQLSYANTGVQVQKVNSGTVEETGILYDSVINPPPSVEAPRMHFSGGFAPGSSTPTTFGNQIVCPQSGYYNMIFTILLTTQSAVESQNAPISFSSPSYITLALYRITSPTNLVEFVTFNTVNIYPSSNLDDITVYRYTAPLTNLMDSFPFVGGNTYQMAAYTNSTYTCGNRSIITLDCVWVGN